MTEATEHRPFFFTLAALLALAALSLYLQWPGAVETADAPAGEFSAERGVASLAALLEAAGGPHPVGSAANARVHEGVVRELEAAGWQVERQRGVGCRRSRSCAALENLIARLPGRGSGPAVLVACHTDSVPAAVGAGDDGAGMAVMLEMARNLAAGPELERPVWLLFDEGEEMGLLGAELFTREMEPGSVGAVVNLEARGTTGPTWMFETSDGGGALVGAYARSVPRPSTSSIAYSVYKRMPNDTDLTVFREAGLAGVGLAFIDGGARYHTPRDDLEHLNTASVQRMGDSALALVRELASRELPLEKSEAVFFDVASLFTVSWPTAFSAPAAVLALLLIALAARGIAPLELARGAAAWLLAVAGAVAGGAFVLAVLSFAGALPTAFPANITWATVAAAAGGVSAAAGTLVVLPTPPRARLLGCLAMFGAVALLVSLFEPAASYPFVLAALAGGAASLRSPRVAGPLAAALLLLTLAPMARMLPVGLGSVGLLGSALLAGLVTTPILPLLPPRPRMAPALVLEAVLILVAALVPALTVDNPLALSIRAQVEIDPESGERSSHALLAARGDVPALVLEAAGPLIETGSRHPVAAIDDPGALPVEVRALERDEAKMRLHLRSPQGAWALFVTARKGTYFSQVAWPGLEPVALEHESSWIRLHAVPPEGVELEVSGQLDIDLRVVDRVLGLPAEAGHLAAARPEWATPIGSGDVTEVVSRVSLADLVVSPGQAPLEEQSEQPTATETATGGT